MPDHEQLPFLDEHRERFDVPADVAWTALVGILRRRMGGAGSLARVLGCDPVEGTPGFSGRVGETLPGFRVVDSEPGRRLALRGQHRFARYALTFLIDGGELCARSEAEFPGVHGRLYRALLMGTGGHRLVTRGLLRQVARAAGRAPA
ncbi:MAG TPA: hypothetical protein VGG91_14700 [Myxococcaceae bacterium]|jgi:hypothetical protein